MPIPPAFITVMSIFNERSYISGFERVEDNFNIYLHLIKHVLIYVSGTYWSWFFVRKVTRHVDNFIHNLFVPSIAKYIDTVGPTINLRSVCSKSLYTAEVDHSLSQRLKNNRSLYADKFVDSIIILDKWTKLAGVKKLAALSDTVNFSCTDDLFSRKIIVELFTTHRSTRLNALLHYLNDSVSDFSESEALAGALSTLIIITIGFPQSFHVNSSSKFRFIDSIMVDALRSSQDSLVFDFVLHYLVAPSACKNPLFQDVVDKHVKNTLISNKYSTPILNAFLKPSSMLAVVPGIKNGLFGYKLRSYVIYSFYNSEQRDTFVNIFEKHTQDILSEIKDIHSLLRNHKCSSGGENLLPTSPPSIDKITLDLEKYELVFVGPDADEIHNMYDSNTFKKDIITCRERYDLIKSKIERLQANVNIDLYHKTYTHPITTKCFDILQRSHEALISSFKQYQDHISQYEKTFALHQIVKFVGAFKLEIENVLQNDSKLDSWYNNDNFKDALKNFVIKSRSIVENKDQICKQFVGLDKTYHNNKYTKHIVTLYFGLVEVTQTLYHTLENHKNVNL